MQRDQMPASLAEGRHLRDQVEPHERVSRGASEGVGGVGQADGAEGGAETGRSASLAEWRSQRNHEPHRPGGWEEREGDQAPRWAVPAVAHRGGSVGHNPGSLLVRQPGEAITFSWLVRRAEVARELERFGWDAPGPSTLNPKP